MVAWVVCAGCQQSASEVGDVQTRLAWLGKLYGTGLSVQEGKPVQSLDSFRKYISTKVTEEQLERLGLNSWEELFVSPRDGQPFKMVTGLSASPPKVGELPPVVFYEANGRDGEFALAYLGGGTAVVEKKELDEQLAKSNH